MQAYGLVIKMKIIINNFHLKQFISKALIVLGALQQWFFFCNFCSQF